MGLQRWWARPGVAHVAVAPLPLCSSPLPCHQPPSLRSPPPPTPHPPPAQTGDFKLTKGEYGIDEGIQSSPKDQARFFAYSAPLDGELKNEGKDLVIAYTVKHEQNLQCGGAYIKLLKKGACGTPWARAARRGSMVP